MAGVSIVEMMIAVTLGLLILAALASIFASSSAARNEIERNSRQIENGRYAIEVLSEELRLAGFYGELNTAQVLVPPALPDVCSNDPAEWRRAIRIAVYGWDQGMLVPTCVTLSNHKTNTDVLVVRRASTCEAGTPGCDPLVVGAPYMQVSRCNTEQTTIDNTYQMGFTAAGWGLRLKGCIQPAKLRRYIVRIFYISRDNGQGQDIPTLKRLDFDGNFFQDTALVEGIEELNIEYGVDWGPINGVVVAPDGRPEAYTTDPTSYSDPSCAGNCTPVLNWSNVVTARIHLLARNIEPSPDYEDRKIYTLGRTSSGNEYDVAPGGNFRRHVYSSLVRVVNAAQRREQPD
jgi:type IV pilus assembly protein PilW